MDPEGTRLLTLLYGYGKPRQCINRSYSSLWSTTHRTAADEGRAAPRIVLQQTAVVLVEVQCQVLNRQH